MTSVGKFAATAAMAGGMTLAWHGLRKETPGNDLKMSAAGYLLLGPAVWGTIALVSRRPVLPEVTSMLGFGAALLVGEQGTEAMLRRVSHAGAREERDRSAHTEATTDAAPGAQVTREPPAQPEWVEAAPTTSQEYERQQALARLREAIESVRANAAAGAAAHPAQPAQPLPFTWR